MAPEEVLQGMGIVLPDPPAPLATYVPAVRAGDLLFLSGILPLREGKLAYEGKLGADVSVEEGYEAAKLTAISALASIKKQLGSLDQVVRVVRMCGHVASAPGFTQQPQVVNGASDFLVEVFGEVGRHARLALGAAELPLNAPIELELIVQAK
ncbi:MAG TPA: RidA family protein [Nitrospirales bacterium]|nr:RidA family protein [Nitrospirales bacterium]HIA14178.1 RidA family protein [Nitrospirales bacterium]HIB55088.1 RidA family protein [Nitrospirales bacterium]HIC04681.1 RidA family protein [Nitrospirales bacterium]HIN34097.1 RidA family protein [Nitrospirales bacterium]